MPRPPLFDTFSPTSKAGWLEKVRKDLKGKPLESLQWQLEETIQVDALFHPEDQLQAFPPIQSAKTENNDWEIGAVVRTNKQALEELMGGVNSLVFEGATGEQLNDLLKDIALSYISTHFSNLDHPTHGLQLLKAITQAPTFERGVKGGLLFSESVNLSDIKWVDLHEFGWSQMKYFNLYTIDARDKWAGTQEVAERLAAPMVQAVQFLETMEALGLKVERVIERMQFAISIGTSFFVEIAKVRAFRLLWANVLAGYGINQPMELTIQLELPTGEDHPNTNMIRSATQAIAASAAGADRIIIPPATTGTTKAATDFHQRIARNVQHILKMESYLDRVIDPAAGSYYIEHLTNRFAKLGWEVFRSQMD